MNNWLKFFQFRNYSLRNKFLFFFIAIALIALASVSAYASLRLRDTLNQKTQENLTTLANQISLFVDTYIQNELNNISLESQTPVFIEYLSSYSSGNPNSTIVSDALADLTSAASQNTAINSIAILNSKGIVVLESNNARGADDSQAAFFQDAIAKKQATITGPLFDQKTGEASLYFSAPIKNQSGVVLGVLVADYNANTIEPLVENLIPLGNPDEVLFRVVDKNYFIRIAHTGNLSLLYKPYKNIAPDQIVTLQEQGLLPPGSSQDILQAVENDTSAGLENATQTPFFETGSKTFGALTLNTVAPMKTVPWLVLVRQSNVTVTTPVNQEIRSLILIALFVIVLITMAAFGISQTLSRPILGLASAAQQIAGGDMTVQAEVKSQDEIGQLANSFNQMTAQLRQTFETVRQRTKDLATVAEISTVTATIREPFEMLSNMVHLTQRGFDLYHAHVFTYQPESEELQIVACGYKEGDEHEGTHGTSSIPMDQEQSLVARAARTRQPVIVNDVRSDPGWLPNPLLPDTHAEMAVPMIVGDELLGVLDVQSEHVDAFTEEDANIQMTLASQVATALQNARAYSRAQKQAELETLVNMIGQKIQRTTSVEETLQTAIRELGMAVGASRVKASIKPTTDGGTAEAILPPEPIVVQAEGGEQPDEPLAKSDETPAS